MSAPTSSGPLPDLTRPDVGAALFSTWSVGTPERQRATVDTIGATWDSSPWPAPELLSYNLYAGTDGDTLMHHSQWADEAAYHAFFRTQRQQRNDAVDSAVPDIERLGLAYYRHYRHYRHYRGLQAPAADQGATTDPGLFVVVEIDFNDPDPQARRSWVDLVIEALESEPDPGLLSADFHLIADGERHLSTDRARVLNYARWTDVEAYEAALAADGPRGGGSSAWDRVRDFPALVGASSRSYRFRRSFVRPSAP